MHLSQKDLFFRHVAQTSPFPLGLEIIEAKGIYLTSKEQKKYIDFISGISVSHIGHCHPAVVEAVKTQAEKFMHLMVYGEYIHAPQVQLATALASLLPANLSSTYLVNSGSEAVEGAVKLAKRYTGRPHVYSFNNAYHGSSQGALSLMGSETFKNAFRPLIPGTKQFPFNHPEILAHIDEQTAAVLVEPIQGEAGYIPADHSFLEALSEKCKSTGTLLIMDEIQSGLGRSGKAFAFEWYAPIVPDILLLAKGLGGGMPIGAFISSPEIMGSLTHQPILGHITTFGGHPVSCAAALACIQTIQQEKLWEKALWIETEIRQHLRHPAIQSITGKGAMLAIQLDNNTINLRLIQIALELGLISDWFLFNDSALRICPPLTITPEELQQSISILQEAFRRL